MCEFCKDINSEYVDTEYCYNMGIVLENGKPHISMILHDDHECECSGISEKALCFALSAVESWCSNGGTFK